MDRIQEQVFFVTPCGLKQRPVSSCTNGFPIKVPFCHIIKWIWRPLSCL